MPETAPRQIVTALVRGLDILRCFDRPRAELGVSEIARRVGLSQPTTWRLCQTLIECGYLVRAPSGSGLRIGAPALTLGYAALHGMAPAELALPYMRRVTEVARGDTSLSKRQALEMIAVERVDGTFVRPNQPIGWRAPIASVAAGLAVLAALSPGARADASATLARTDPHWERHRDRIERAAEQYASQGFVTVERVMRGDYTAAAVALFVPGSDPAHQWAMSCGAVADLWTPDDVARAGAALAEAQRLLAPALPALSA